MCNRGLKNELNRDTFFSCSGFQHHIHKVALHEYWPMSSGDALISSWPTLCGGGTGPRKAVGVCGPSSTRATKVPWHHSPGEPTGVGEGP
jgi:hypothetical protein